MPHVVDREFATSILQTVSTGNVGDYFKSWLVINEIFRLLKQLFVLLLVTLQKIHLLTSTTGCGLNRFR